MKPAAPGIGTAVRNARLAKGMTAEELGHAIRLKGGTVISYIELGEQSPTVEQVLLIAEALDVEPGALVSAADYTSSDVRAAIEAPILGAPEHLMTPKVRADLLRYVRAITDRMAAEEEAERKAARRAQRRRRTVKT